MKGLSTNPRVLLSTVYRRFRGDYIDALGWTGRRFSKASAPLRVSPGLRFIKQNVPEVEILEYPLWQEYVARLREGWDVAGFSFYHNQIGEIRDMIAEARRQGVREIWGGNYGVLDYEIPKLLDRIFTGPAEDEIARVFGYRVHPEDTEHPVMMAHFSYGGGVRHLTLGMLYTAHGCPFSCSFCQTPVFEKCRLTINLESIKRVLAYYRKRGITDIIVLDELFGAYPKLADRVSRLLARHRFRWWAQSRAAIFLKHLDTWYDRGLRLPSVGVESMSQKSLDNVNKRQKIEEVLEFVRRSRSKPGMQRIGFSMIGYEDMNAEETLEDAMRFKEADFDYSTVCILTPFPQTPLWEELSSKYGIFDRDPRHYRLRHLVWRHPHISPLQMRYLLRTIKALLNRPADLYRKGVSRLIWGGLRKNPGRFLWRTLVKSPIASMLINDRRQIHF